jgi:D-glucosaminate-specific PTS system IIC component
MYLGINAPGGQLPADKYIAGAIAIPLALQTDMKTGVAVALAVPLAMIGAQLLNLKKVITVALVPVAEKQVEAGDSRGLTRTTLIYPMLLGIPLFYLPVFVSVMFGAKVVTPIMNAIPDWLMHGLVVSGGLLPAIGFSLTLMMIGKDKYLPYFILGFILISVLKVPTIVAAVVAACVASVVLVMKQEIKKENTANE